MMPICVKIMVSTPTSNALGLFTEEEEEEEDDDDDEIGSFGESRVETSRYSILTFGHIFNYGRVRVTL